MIKCMIVDDEALARQVIQSHLQMMHGFQVVAICSNASEAGNRVKKF